MSRPPEAVIPDVAKGLDLDRRRNYAQLAPGLVVSVRGAVWGFFSVSVERDS
ncbi:MAG TPA: hypothetical protein VG826_02120 [Pirellulales bacterium]|nr:hypothetical protein [Pirellulales bacterium]